MTKEQIISRMMENPSYDSTWIDKAATMILDQGFTEEELSQYTYTQLAFIEQATKLYNPSNPDDGDELFIELIKNPKLNETQMQILSMARSKGVNSRDLKDIASPSLPYGKMNYAAQAMIDGFFIGKEFNLSELSTDQIYEIVAGYHDGVDYHLYADSRIPPERMCVIRNALIAGYSFEYEFSTGNIKLLLPQPEVIKLERID